MPSRETFSCPGCGEDVPSGAKACPHCGASEKSGWNEESDLYERLDLPEDDFKCEKLVEQGFGEPRNPGGKELFWKITAAFLLILIIALIFSNLLFRG